MKVLGVNWDSNADKFVFDLCNIVEFAKSLPVTKRSLLKIVAKLFDPLGCLSVFTINFKILFQQLCVDKIGWDKVLKGSYRERYEKLMKDLEKVHDVDIPRCLVSKGSEIKKVQLHGFLDASIQAYAAVVYLRIEYVCGKVEIKFLASKSKVSPIKSQSIPRLELLGACLLAKLVNTLSEILKEELGQQRIDRYYWTDSYSVLCWIGNEKPWNQYVPHCVSQILETSNREHWFHYPGVLNPADLPSRGK